MRKFLSGLFMLSFLCGAAAFAAPSPVVVQAGHEKWVKQDDGSWLAVLSGDPSKTGPYVVRLKTPANWSFPPHTHPMTENVTIISGTFYAGLGTKADPKKMAAYGPGTFIMMPANLPHFAMTKTPAVIELSGMGPMKDVMVK